ncbi:putative RNA 2'-phosphotransferase [Amycolatopsis arida]|uniref:Probable RNA 2'-phosphotransferase n=1 Tax=Amycolatopsis arida TaxID=587909 RepID=A0A1I5XVP9_9PSEU|nr:RNA 2'-phosphotransferase [Amycolatopsis arida]TDX97237.1 putative RNA 2'-phosphotransferase [Amycolatopsis arida]SFQ36018.1 putative RNA 2'-phosphotransferase [Amycolatopsis arida]
MKHSALVRASKRISRHLRHAPHEIGLELEPGGWVAVDDLLAALARHGVRLTRAELDEVVAGNDKRRFGYDETGRRIRANQGHTVRVELDLPVATPPDVLYHGTVEHVLDAIRREGLRPMRRHDVHLSTSPDTATAVGARRGRPVVLTVDAHAMHAAGHRFRVSANGVWLVPHVPPRFLRAESHVLLDQPPDTSRR